MANGEPADEVRDALTPQLKQEINLALLEVQNDLAPPTTKDQLSEVTVELGRYMSLAGGGWPTEQRTEWINSARTELKEFPAAMLVDSIRRARKRVGYPGGFVPWVVADLEPAVDKLKVEQKRLADLREIARS